MTPGKEGPPTFVDKDEQAWKKIVEEMDSGSIVEAKAIFLTRCAESAKEALEPSEKRRAALEEVAEAVAEVHKDHGPMIYKFCEFSGAKLRLVRAMGNLSILTPALQNKEATK